MYTELNYTNSLCHFGIKDQKWGIRRYQNADGSLTPAGKARYAKTEMKTAEKEYRKEFDNAYNYNRNHPIKSNFTKKGKAISENNWYRVDSKEEDYDKAIDKYHAARKESRKADKAKLKEAWDNADKKKLAIAAGTTVAAAGFAYAMYNPTSRKAIKEFTKKTGTVAVKELKESSKRAGKAMTDAALVSIGTITISKLAKKLDPGPNASEREKNINKVALDTATAGIESVTKAKSGNNTNNQNNGSVGRHITEKIGAPRASKGSAKQDPNYSKLFQNLPGDQNQKDKLRAEIKSMAAAGYDIDQINAYINSIYHSATYGYHAVIKFL